MSEHEQMQENVQSSTEQNTVQSPSRQKDATKQRTDPNVLQRAVLNPASLLAGDILQLQKTIGNQAVIQLLSAETQKSASNDTGQQLAAEEQGPQQRPNFTGMPDNLKSGLETMSGLDMSDVRVHRNSDQPMQIGALAYTRGSHIYVGPGQEKHLPHEAWHVVQQKQGRVRPTLQTRGLLINDDRGLEKESDLMGKKAIQMKSSQELYLNSVLAGSLHTSRDISANTTPTLQARFWDSDMTQPLSLQELFEKISEVYPQYSQKLDAFKGMNFEGVDYILPKEQEQYKSTLEMWVDAYENRELVDVGKMIKIINSILNNGILNQVDRQKMLNSSTKAKTSTDDVKGSQNVHGISLKHGNTTENQERAKYAQQQSVNVLAEVKDDPVFGGTRTRIESGLLSQDERNFIIDKLMGVINCFDFYSKLKNQLIENKDETGFVKVDVKHFVLEKVLEYALNKVADSERGRNEINKRMMTGFLSIVDSEKIPKEKWDMKLHNDEGVVKESIPPTLILKMILPKYLEQYSGLIDNQYDVPIVYQYIEYPAEGEIHLMSPRGERFKLRNEINLMWQEQINEALETHKEVLTHMTRGF